MSKAGQISDGYHTFDELYEHRHALFIALILSNPTISWRAINNADGTNYDGWFIAGMHLSSGDISYHLPLNLWSELDTVKTSENAPDWDGHTSNDVVSRLNKWDVGQ